MSADYANAAAVATAAHVYASLRKRLPDSDHLILSGTEHGEIDITVVRLSGDTDEHMRSVIDRIDHALMGDHLPAHDERRPGHPRVRAVHGRYLGIAVHATATLNGRTK